MFESIPKIPAAVELLERLHDVLTKPGPADREALVDAALVAFIGVLWVVLYWVPARREKRAAAEKLAALRAARAEEANAVVAPPLPELTEEQEIEALEEIVDDRPADEPETAEDVVIEDVSPSPPDPDETIAPAESP